MKCPTCDNSLADDDKFFCSSCLEKAYERFKSRKQRGLSEGDTFTDSDIEVINQELGFGYVTLEVTEDRKLLIVKSEECRLNKDLADLIWEVRVPGSPTWRRWSTALFDLLTDNHGLIKEARELERV